MPGAWAPPAGSKQCAGNLRKTGSSYCRKEAEASPCLQVVYSRPEALPEHAQSTWQVGRLRWRADFDSANLADVRETAKDSEFQVWIRRDCQDSAQETAHRTWFYFSIAGACKGQTVTITIMNMNKQAKLYSQDFRPVFRSHPSMQTWQRIRTHVIAKTGADDLTLQFSHCFGTSEETLFAFAIPWSYSDNQALLERLDQAAAQAQGEGSAILYQRQLLTRSLDGRRIDLLTITVQDHQATCCPGRPGEADSKQATDLLSLQDAVGAIPGRQVVFISARVHPGETPASHMLNGMLSFLLSRDDPRAAALRQRYLFVIVPMLNPDGVALGHTRCDSRGQNLNRCYQSPCRDEQPGIWAVKQLLSAYADQGQLAFYFDLHAHANKRGVFAYGNALQGPALVEALTFTLLASLNSPYFDLGACNFSEENMSMRDKRGESKDGAGRVALFRETGLTHLYTIEANYNSCRLQSLLASTSGREQPPNITKRLFDMDSFWGMGSALLVAVLDLGGSNGCSRLPNTAYRDVQGVRKWMQACLKETGGRKAAGMPALSRQGSAGSTELCSEAVLAPSSQQRSWPVQCRWR